MGKNQARVLQPAQQFRMLLRKEFESPGFVGLYPGYFQDNLGETGDLRIVDFAICPRRITFFSEMCDCLRNLKISS